MSLTALHTLLAYAAHCLFGQHELDLARSGVTIRMTNIHEAKSQLSKLVERALAGEEVVIAKAGKPMVRLVPVRDSDAPRKGGQWKGRVRIADDFDELPEDIARAFGMDGE